MNFILLHATPAKPREGEPCNGCGVCCSQEVCGIGRMAFGDVPAPCPGLMQREIGKRCALVELEAKAGVEPMIANALGIGRGCCGADSFHCERGMNHN